MTDKEYFELSQKNKLPNRCPILGKCERYAQTVLFLSELYKYGEGSSMTEKLLNEGYLNKDYEKNKIESIGEPFRFHKGELTCSIKNACPEVSLFDNSFLFGFIPKKPIADGFWDELDSPNRYNEDGKFRVQRETHFSMCAEFSNYHYNKKPVKSDNSRRTPISSRMRFEIFQRDNFTCFYCNRNKDIDKVKLTLDHIKPVAEGGKDDFSNLVTCCEECNSGKSNKII